MSLSHQYTLEQVTKLIKRGITPKYAEDEGYAVINQKCIRDGALNLSLARLTHLNTKINEEKVLQDGDILVNSTGTGTVGRTAPFLMSVGEESIHFVDTHVTIVRPNKDLVDPLFLAFALRTKEKQIENMAKGATNQVELSAKELSSLTLNIPELGTQRKISKILMEYEKLIENNKRRIALLEESARLLYREWFVHFRFPGHEHVKIIDGLPEGWKKGCVGDFYKTASGGTPSRKKPDFYTGDINWVKTQELQDGFIFSTQEKITEDAVQNSSAKVFPVNTVLVAMYGATIGQTGILATSAATNQACCAILMKDDHASYEYAYLYFREMKKQLINFSKGAAQNNVSQDIIKNLDMVLPSQLITKSFKAYTKPLLAQIKTLQLQNQKLTQARDILLPRLMNGDLAV